MLAFSQAILYVCLMFLMGTFILKSVPTSARPDIAVPKKALLIAAILLPIAAFIPVFDVIIHLENRLGFWQASMLTITSTTVGLSWIATVAFSVMLILVIAKGNFPRYSILILTLIIATLAWSRHTASIQFTTGIINDFIHTLAMSAWVGTLFVVSFFSKNDKNWLAFLKWFTILAAVCLFVIMISGLLLMGVLIPGYVASWITSYGQGLFIKHLFLIPIVFLAFANSVIGRFLLKRDYIFNPFPWVRAESIFLICILIVTAIFTQQQPPIHELTDSMISPVFEWLHGGISVGGDTILSFAFSGAAVGFLSLATVAICVFLMSFLIRKIPVYATTLIGFVIVISVYLFVMKSVVLL
ncbi:copper resistance D family protein [Kurthia senegalensis]|uniref:copper resistance D family protein n=1 Tax=Kurthia senegalensis TaxID=1033740 RepID=UPI000287FE26|nr:copper-binding protein [Kurthia senegalensis]